jgi:hypothetical protein
MRSTRLFPTAVSFLYPMVRRVLDVVRLHWSDSTAREAEILVLRHQLSCFVVRSRGLALAVRPCPCRPSVSPRATRALEFVPRHAADDPQLAPSAGPQALDLPTPAAWTPGPSQRDREADLLLGSREPPVGLSADSGRAQKTRHHRVEDERRCYFASPRPPAGSPARGSDLERVPLSPG